MQRSAVRMEASAAFGAAGQEHTHERQGQTHYASLDHRACHRGALVWMVFHKVEPMTKYMSCFLEGCVFITFAFCSVGAIVAFIWCGRAPARHGDGA